ncbi:hypothetical protein Tsubulata_032618, partial [Turnera subulata]
MQGVAVKAVPITGGEYAWLPREEDGGSRRSEDVEEGRPKEPWKGEYGKSIMYGGLDAIITCFSLISSISASKHSSVLGFANLVADGISMGLGDFVSSRTEKDAASKERTVTKWDVTNHSRSQQQELIQKYHQLGMNIDDATTITGGEYAWLPREEDGGSRRSEDVEEGRPKEPWKGEYGKSIMYGGLDAIITCFSLISSISASKHSSVLGFANLVADGISMGLGDFVSSRTEKDAASKERTVTKWDVTNHSRSQQQELIQKYHQLGMNIDDATTVVEIFAKYRDILIDEKMMVEKGMSLPDGDEKPWKNALFTFGAFLMFGSIPLLSFLVLIPFTDSDLVKFIGACAMAILAMAALGIARAKIAGQNYVLSVAITVCNGVVAAAAAYGITWMLRN